MSIKATVKKDEESGEYYFDILDLADLFEDISIIEYYTMEESVDGVFTLELFDKNNNKIYPNRK
jgi:hypothetical protein